MKSIRALYLAQARQFSRDRMQLILVIILPVILGVFFGVMFSGSGPGSVRLGVAVSEDSPLSAALTEMLSSPELSDYVTVSIGALSDMDSQLAEDELDIVLYLPAEAAAETGQPAVATIKYDPSNIMAGSGVSIVQGLVNQLNQAASGAPPILVLKKEAVSNGEYRSIDFYMPGMLGVAILWLGLFGTAMPVVAQRGAQVYRRMSVTPLTKPQILAAETAWRVTVGLIQATVFVAVGYFGFQVGVQNWPLFISTILLGTVGFVSLGYFLAGVSTSAEILMALTQIANLPIMMLSGSMFPIESLPEFLQPVVKYIPLTYLSDLLRYSMVGMPPHIDPAISLAVLAGTFVVLSTLAARFWRWE